MNQLTILFGLSETLESQIYILLIVIFIALIIFSFAIQSKFKKTTTYYSAKASTSNKTGAEVARMILKENGITDVQVVKSGNTNRGFIDNFNPMNKVVTLSSSIYDSTSLTAIAIASHEVGHAIQYNKGTVLIKIRTRMVKPVAIVSQIGSFIFQIGFSIFFFALLIGSSFNIFI